MSLSKLRRKIAWEAARLLYSREESEYFQAKRKAARRIVTGWVRPADLPSNAEIRDEVRLFARLIEGNQGHEDRLLAMRQRACWWMEQLAMFHPRLIGSVLTGHVRDGSDIDIHVFTGNPSAVARKVEDHGLECELERKRIVKDGECRVFTHIHIRDTYPIELTIYHPSLLGHRFRSSIDGKPIPRATTTELIRMIALETEQSESNVRKSVMEQENPVDRWRIYDALLVPLERVQQHPKYHPEGDALYHSLQVFELAREAMPYDEEFLLAALLHDIGKAIDPEDHVGAGLEALDGLITPRTEWLIANHMLAHGLRDGSLGARARRRLRQQPWYEDLLELAACDAAGRERGVTVDDSDAALDYIRSLETMFD
ncbi:Multifunctional CCA protein [Roseimaritima multifibrata]|uniref:Multifunctional CCA protein n=1 Tax=Roseimaritima multifibrata TaxID=1930274 RepID=A0A517M8R8_9BACT|nr:HD domain-containing protein [Roseimaritima multifibrata]QDS91278.1 Multifunctional CCA protein [Roseimaritima multifibrata]